jgi:hypothetical protein
MKSGTSNGIDDIGVSVLPAGISVGAGWIASPPGRIASSRAMISSSVKSLTMEFVIGGFGGEGLGEAGSVAIGVALLGGAAASFAATALAAARDSAAAFELPPAKNFPTTASSISGAIGFSMYSSHP